MKRLYLFTTAAAAALSQVAISPAFAQQASPDSGASAQAQTVPGATDPQGLGEIIVTARKISEKAQSVPVAITAFGAQELKARGAADLRDVATITPGLSLSTPSGGGIMAVVALRGQSEVSPAMTLDQAVGVYIDNVYRARSASLGVGLFDLAQVEVLKGPQGTLFGRNTTGGAINITTADPTKEFSGYLDGSYGNYNARHLEGAVSIPLADNLGVRFSGSTNQHDGYVRNLTLNNDTQTGNTQAVRGKLVWTPGKFEVRIGADYSHANQSSVPVIPTALTACNLIPAAAAGGYNYNSQGFFNPNCPTSIAAQVDAAVPGALAALRAQNAAQQSNPRITYAPSNGFSRLNEWGVSGSIGYDFGSFQIKSITAFREVHTDNLFSSDGSSIPGLSVDFILKQKQFTEELQITGKALNDTLTYAVGYYFFRESGSDIIDEIIAGTPQFVVLNDYDVNKSNSVYAQATYAVPQIPHLKINAGLRIGSDDRQVTVLHTSLVAPPQIVNGVVVAPAGCNLSASLILASGTPGICAATVSHKFNGHSVLVGLDYALSNKALVYASYREGFRSGGFSGRGLDLDTLKLVRPEVIYSHEVGLKLDWSIFGMPVRTNVAAFYDIVHDRQREFTQVANGSLTTVTTNVQRGIVKGLEFEGRVKPVPDLTLTGTLAYIDAYNTKFIYVDPTYGSEDHTNDVLPETPKWHYTLGALYAHPVDIGGTLEAAIDYSWMSSQSFGFSPDPSVTSKPYGLINVRAGWSNIAEKNFSVHVFAKNLSNKTYINGGTYLVSSFGYSNNTFGAPRTYGIEAGFKF